MDALISMDDPAGNGSNDGYYCDYSTSQCQPLGDHYVDSITVHAAGIQATPLPAGLPLFATGLGRWACLAGAGRKNAAALSCLIKTPNSNFGETAALAVFLFVLVAAMRCRLFMAHRDILLRCVAMSGLGATADIARCCGLDGSVAFDPSATNSGEALLLAGAFSGAYKRFTTSARLLYFYFWGRGCGNGMT